MMIDYTESQIEKVSIHYIGNPLAADNLITSKAPHHINQPTLEIFLRNYFLSQFTTPEFYKFTSSNQQPSLNPLYQFVQAIFLNPNESHIQTIFIAKHLFEQTKHPQIKSGNLFVCQLKNIIVEGKYLNAIGIFKAENKQVFLNIEENFEMKISDGFSKEKLDKGCLIFDTNEENGYQICLFDKANKGGEAQFWRDDFLNVTPISNEYSVTKQFLNVTKQFVTKQLPEEFQVDKADQIDLLNRSVNFFKKNEAFTQADFDTEVLIDERLVESFKNYRQTAQTDFDIEIEDQFSISPQAVKKSAKVFKSVLKLDKNFHIYIHGNRDLIEKGTDENGRKYYKIYYSEEF